MWDNIDFGEETLSGHGTTHHTNGIMLQSAAMEMSTVPRETCVKKGARSLVPQNRQIESYIHQKRHGPKQVGEITDINPHLYKSDLSAATTKDLKYVIIRFSQDDSNLIPGWTGFNATMLANCTVARTAIHYLPVIEASPTSMSTVNAILNQSLEIADRLALNHIVLVFNQAIYAKAQEIRWLNDIFIKRLVIRMGDFHTSMSFMSVIGKRFKDAGLQDILIESEAVGQGSINGVISGHHYNRSIRTHKLMYEALQRMRSQRFLESLTDEEVTSAKKLLKEINDAYATPAFENLNNNVDFTSLLNQYQAFVTQQSGTNPTFAFWSSYIDIVQLLLAFVRATRESDWNLHLSALRFMMPWFFAYDRTNYARYVPAYWLEVISLPDTHPQCHQELSQKGQWTVQRQDQHAFSSIACDQAIEQTANRDSKTSGGLTGISLNRAASQRWILTQPHRAAITRKCEQMANLVSDDVQGTKELSRSQILKDERDIKSIMATIENMINPFDNSSDDLICLS